MRAFKECPLDKLRVVIFGQDPYHNGSADGLAFSTRAEKRPASLNVIFKEIYRDLDIKQRHGDSIEEYFETNDLTQWTKIGFLLLNTCLTVTEGKANSHKDFGWDEFILFVIDVINKYAPRPVIFLLWGNNAAKLIPKIKEGTHIYFTSPHPAAELYGGESKFSGCGHFSLVRDIVCSWMSKSNPDSEFEMELLEKVINEYPEKDRIFEYIDQGKILSNAFNGDKFRSNIRKFEEVISTKKPKDE